MPKLGGIDNFCSTSVAQDEVSTGRIFYVRSWRDEGVGTPWFTLYHATHLDTEVMIVCCMSLHVEALACWGASMRRMGTAQCGSLPPPS